MGLSPDPRGPAAAEFVRRASGAREARLLSFERLSGGAIQDNFALALELEGGSLAGRQTLVLRTDAPSGVAASLGRAEEFAVLRVAHQAGVAVPEPLWLCTDPAVIGTDFYLMRRAPGSAAARQLVRAERSEAQRAALVGELGGQLARLHRVRPPHPELGFLSEPRDDPARHRVALYRGWLEQLPQPRPTLEWALAWLADCAPEPGQVCLCHCDYRTGNLLLAEGRLAAILDWEFAAWSDPYEDLGWFCARCWRFGAWDQEAGGLGPRSAFYEGYRAGGGAAVDHGRVLYWEVMATVRWAVIALQQAQRHLSGEQASLELALTGRMVPEMELDLLQQIPALEAGDGA